MSHNYIVKKAYNSTLELHDLGQTNWCTYVENILNEAHLKQAWEEQSINNRQFALLTEQFHRSYMESCLKNINNSTLNRKLRTFKHFKED